MNVLLIGEEAAGIKMLRALAEREVHVAGVLTRERRGVLGASLWEVASGMGYPTWDARLVTEGSFADTMRGLGVDIALNVHSLYIIHPLVLAAPRYGCFNLHPGLLPEYAGLDTVSWAIFLGSPDHGVTIHRMVSEVDEGPIVYQESFPIVDTDSALSLSARCVRLGVHLMLRLLDQVLVDPTALPMTQQDLSRRRYFRRAVPFGGRLRISGPAASVVRFVRACDYFPLASPWGHPRVNLEGGELGIVRAEMTGIRTSEPCGSVRIVSERRAQMACADQWISVSKVLSDGRVVEATDLLTAGMVLEEIDEQGVRT